MARQLFTTTPRIVNLSTRSTHSQGGGDCGTCHFAYKAGDYTAVGLRSVVIQNNQLIDVVCCHNRGHVPDRLGYLTGAGTALVAYKKYRSRGTRPPFSACLFNNNNRHNNNNDVIMIFSNAQYEQ